MRAPMSLLLLAFTMSACAAPATPGREPILGDCEGCENVFIGQPARFTSHARIAPASEPGEPLRIDGRVTDAAGKPRAGVIVYAYHTDAGGIYPRSPPVDGRPGPRHGALRGWARTDAAGNYRFDTIRPASYPNADVPQHVHMHVIEPGCSTYWIDDIHFTDDPRLTKAQIAGVSHGRGGNGIATPSKRDGTLFVRRDIVLGHKVEGYRACAAPRAG